MFLVSHVGLVSLVFGKNVLRGARSAELVLAIKITESQRPPALMFFIYNIHCIQTLYYSVHTHFVIPNKKKSNNNYSCNKNSLWHEILEVFIR